MGSSVSVPRVEDLEASTVGDIYATEENEQDQEQEQEEEHQDLTETLVDELTDSLEVSGYYLLRSSEDADVDEWLLVNYPDDGMETEEDQIQMGSSPFSVTNTNTPSWWESLTTSIYNPSTEPETPKTEREEELLNQVRELQVQMRVLHKKWESIITQPTSVIQGISNNASEPQFVYLNQTPNMPTSASIPLSAVPRENSFSVPTASHFQGTDPVVVAAPGGVPFADVPPAPSAASVPPSDIPVPPSDIPVPPPPPSDIPAAPPLPGMGGGPKKTTKPKKKSKQVMSTEQLKKQVSLFIQASELAKPNHQMAIERFCSSFTMKGGNRILQRMVTDYHFLIKKYPLDPPLCCKLMLQWESKLFSKVPAKQAVSIRKKKWYEISTLQTEEEIENQILLIKKSIEREKKKLEEQKKMALLGGQRNSIIDELKQMQKKDERAAEAVKAKSELEGLKTNEIDLADSMMLLELCEDDDDE